MGCDWYNINSTVVEGYGFVVTCDKMADVIEEIEQVSKLLNLEWFGVGTIIKSLTHLEELMDEKPEIYEYYEDFINCQIILGKSSLIIFCKEDTMIENKLSVPGPYEITSDHRFNKVSFKLNSNKPCDLINDNLEYIGYGNYLITGTTDNFCYKATYDEYSNIDKIKTESILEILCTPRKI